jgi:hypothetical protein
MNMIDAELNSRILKLSPKHSVSDHAPYSFESLKASSVSGLVVWSGASDKTIYGAPSVNWAFRAWHDSLHLKLNAPFTLEGETLVALEQCRLIGSDQWAKIIMGEVIGQVEYLNKYGTFPADQIEFMRKWLKGIL